MTEGCEASDTGAVHRKVAGHIRRKEVDLHVCLERTERFAEDIAPIIEELRTMAAEGACDEKGRPLGWTVEPVAPEDTPGYREKAFYSWESSYGKTRFFRPCCLKVGFLDGAGSVVNVACILARTVAEPVHTAGCAERGQICFPYRSETYLDFMRLHGEGSTYRKSTKQARNVADEIRPSFQGGAKDEHFEKGVDAGFSVASIPDRWVGGMAGWVRDAALAKVDPSKAVRPEASQELADKRAAAMIRLAVIAAAKTCGRTQEEVNAAQVGEPASEASLKKAGWVDRIMGR